MTREQQSLAIGQDAHDLQSLVTRLWSWRLNPNTADLLLMEEGNLWSALGSLRELVTDMRSDLMAAE